MRIAIVNLTSGGLSGGYQKYLRRLVPLLRADSRVASVDMFMHPAGMSVGEDGLVESIGHRRMWSSHRALRSAIRDARPDVIFIPTARFLRVDRIPTVVMVRNMEPLVAAWGGNDLAEGCKNVLRASVARLACMRADRVIAVSRFVSDFLEGRWGIDRSRIGVVYHGVEQADGAGGVMPNALQAQMSAAESFLFTAGSVRPARGLEDLFSALGEARRSGVTIRLVVAGQTDPSGRKYAGRIRRLAKELGIGAQVIWAGSLTTSEMAWCFEHCAAFVMTSRAEACPNIALEAMARGALCVSTDTAPMPEFFGPASLYYRARESASLTEVLRQALSRPKEERLRLKLAARGRAGDFSWHATARATVDELTRATTLAGSNQSEARSRAS